MVSYFKKKQLSFKAFLNRVQKFLEAHFFMVVLVCITMTIVLSNFTPHQWLTGWDTLHPEFNFDLNVQRMIFGAWREDQGLGAVAAHAHMSDLPRILSLIGLWLFMPLGMVKFGYVLLCLIFGPLGIYYFTKEVLRTKTTPKTQVTINAASFISGLVYLLNLGTVQHFYVVFEMFAVQYAALGWLFYLALKYLRETKKKYLLKFFLVTLMATPMAYASLLWFAYFAGLGLFLASYSFFQKKKPFKRIVVLFAITLATNLFWLLPNLYFLFSGASQIPRDSHINSLFSEEAFLHNQAYGGLKDVAILKNFLFNWNRFNFQTGQFEPLLQTWQSHLDKPGVLIIGYVVSILVLLGLFLAFLRQKKAVLALFPTFLLGFIMVTNANGITENLFMWLREHSDIFAEALRFPFTKFSLLLMMPGSVFVGYFSLQVFEFFEKLGRKAFLFIVPVTLFFSACLIYYSLPMFQGELIGRVMKNQIPQEYFRFFSWAKDKPLNYRMAIMPVYSYAGWKYHDWGYEGPGFEWFGLKQPVLVRDFDRWNAGNETFYNQISTAVYGRDFEHFKKTLAQYDVGYVVLDESVIVPRQSRELLYFKEIKNLLTEAEATRVWQDGFLTVYDVSHLSKISRNTFVSSPETITYISGDANYGKLDSMYEQVENYASKADYSQVFHETIVFPFADFTKETLPNFEYHEYEGGLQKISYTRNFDKSLLNVNLNLPKFDSNKEYSLPIIVKLNGESIDVKVNFPYQLYDENNQALLGSEIYEVSIPVSKSYPNLFIKIGNSYFTFTDMNALVGRIVSYSPTKPLVADIYGLVDDVQDEDSLEAILDSSTDLNFGVKNFLESTINESSKQTINLSQMKIEVLSEINRINLANSKNEFNCELYERGSISKVLVDDGIIYSASNLGAVCDSIALDKYSNEFVIRIKGDGDLGRGSKVSVTNWENNYAEVEKLLPHNEFEKTFGVLNSTLYSSGFSFNLETRSFGKKNSQNKLSFAEDFLYPFSTISKISLVPQDNSSSIVNKVAIEDINSIGNSFYSAELRAQGERNIYYLSQSYDPAWLAFSLNPNIKQGSMSYNLAQFLPWLYGQKLPHFKYNGWANAWQVPEGEHQIVIIYWPQLLSFAGYGMLVATFAGFGVVFLRNKLKKKAR